MDTITVQTRSRDEMVDITRDVAGFVRSCGVKSGHCVIFVPHTTAGITINEHADPDVVDDMNTVLNRLVPWTGPYKHNEGNSAAHVKASLMGSSVTVLIEDGKLQLGTWQGIFFCEYDGPRTRKAWISVVAD